MCKFSSICVRQVKKESDRQLLHGSVIPDTHAFACFWYLCSPEYGQDVITLFLTHRQITSNTGKAITSMTRLQKTVICILLAAFR
jgi:hypothetical protein